MPGKKIILDTNVLYAGLYSRRGASHKILRDVDRGEIEIVLSTTLVFEYEDVLRRNQLRLDLSDKEVDDVLDNLCDRGSHHRVYFLWRPQLSDPKDDHILELAVASGTATIVTHNTRHFAGLSSFAVKAVPPKQLLEEIR